jgi:GNAT superfamily N-acetyltransferase
MMHFREATLADIPAIQVVRNAVKENVLSDPSRVTDQDCAEYISGRGKGWVCEAGDAILGFAIADLEDDNIWALFIHPDHERRGIGKRLHDTMLDWYFAQGKERVWLSTSPATRAEQFYRKAGWQEAGKTSSGEIRFEMNDVNWKKRSL